MCQWMASGACLRVAAAEGHGTCADLLVEENVLDEALDEIGAERNSRRRRPRPSSASASEIFVLAADYLTAMLFEPNAHALLAL